MSFCCETCWVPVDNNGNGLQHFNSKAHQNAVDFKSNKSERKLKFSCETCSLEISSSIMLQAHLAGSKHKNCELIREKYTNSLFIPLSKDMIASNCSMKKSVTTLDISSSEGKDVLRQVKASSVPRSLSSFDIKEAEFMSSMETKAYGQQIKINGIYETLAKARVKVYRYSSKNNKARGDSSERNRTELKLLDDEFKKCLENMRQLNISEQTN